MALKKIRALIITKLNNNKPHRKSTKTTPDSHRINSHKLLLGYQQIRCHILRVQWQSVLIIFITSNSCQNKLAMSRTKGKTTNKTWKRKGIVFNSIFKICFQIWDVSRFWLVYRKNLEQTKHDRSQFHSNSNTNGVLCVVTIERNTSL